MDTRWTQHLKNDPEKKKAFENLIRNSTLVLGRLLEIIVAEDAKVSRSELSEDDFKDPSWSYKQAFRNGQRSEFKKLADLLGFLGERHDQST